MRPPMYMAQAATLPQSSDVVEKAIRALTTDDDDLLTSPLVTAASLLLIGSFFWFPAGLYWFYRKKCTTRTRKIAFVVALVILLGAPLPVDRRLTKLWIWERFLRYFKARVVPPNDSGKLTQALFAVIPHGIFPFGIAMTALTSFNAEHFLKARPVVASAITFTPLVGHILRAIGAVPASPPAVTAALRSGLSLCLAPGGIAEIFWGWPRPGCDRNKEYALLRDRKGFVRRAVEAGVPLVPVYVFGISDTFKRVPLPGLFETLSRFLKASIVLFYGSWGLPVPFRIPVHLAMGVPILPDPGRVPGSPAGPAEVDSVHARFCEAVVALFERHKAEYGWGDRQLEIV
ncbi:unnamed protein product [Phaeothamnion confervicola]